MTAPVRSAGWPLLPAFLFLLLSLLSTEAFAGTAEEISHLLQYIEKSECVFFRNEKEHTPAEALEHIRMKYEHVRKKVKAAEDFIEYAAMKSSLSGKPYLVRCAGKERPTGEWLREELVRFRQPAASPEK